MKKLKTEKGITLIALIITIIVMLILVGVSVTVALNGGLFKAAQDAAKGTKTELEHENTLANGGVTIGGIKYNSIDEYIEETGKNLPPSLWDASWTYGKEIVGGVVQDGEGSSVSDFVDVTPGTTYVLQCQFNDIKNKDLHINYYNSSEEALTKSVLGFTVNSSWIFTVPENQNISLARFAFYRTGGTEDELNPTNTKLYRVSELQANGYTLAGKTILGFGDSITSSNTLNCRSYLYQIADKNYMNAVNKAQGGYTIRVIEGRNDNILSQIESTTSVDPEYILFNGLTNDINDQLLADSSLYGTISDGFSSEFDTSTFCGAFEATIKAMKEKWPTAKIIYVTTHVNVARDLEAQEDLTELAIQICNKWNIAIADIYHDSGLNTFDTDMFETYIDNGSHPNTLGYTTYYVPIIQAKIIELAD